MSPGPVGGQRIRSPPYFHNVSYSRFLVQLVVVTCSILCCDLGKSTDTEIVTQSGFLDLLDPDDEVLADKGFPQIRQVLGDKLVMPPFARTNQQFTPEECQEGYKVASLRIHVERAIARIKIFNIIKKTIPLSLMGDINRIIYVACFLSNLCPDLIARE